MSRLARDVLEHTFGFLDATKVAETGVASRAWHSAAASPSLWLALAEARWPAVAAMQSIVRARGPREFYRARATADHVKREPSAFDASKHLMTLEFEQHGRVVCSVAREAADIFREELADDDSRTTAPGLLFDELDARFDCRSGRFIGELSQASVKFTVCVVRKSDGLVAPLVPPYYLEADEGWGFGERARSYCPDRCFPANQKLSGLPPFRMRGIPNQLGFISHRDDPGVIGACVSIGDTDEFPPHNMDSLTQSLELLLKMDFYPLGRLCQTRASSSAMTASSLSISSRYTSRPPHATVTRTMTTRRRRKYLEVYRWPRSTVSSPVSCGFRDDDSRSIKFVHVLSSRRRRDFRGCVYSRRPDL